MTGVVIDWENTEQTDELGPYCDAVSEMHFEELNSLTSGTFDLRDVKFCDILRSWKAFLNGSRVSFLQNLSELYYIFGRF